jgi:AcrR family transcriptional regulator
MSSPAKRRSKREPLSRERVLRAAVHLADTIGLAELSMRRLGEELGVEAMSLYNHVANKDEILDGIADLVTGEIALPNPRGDWKEEMRRRAISAHEVLMRHPWATMVIVSRVNVGPAMLRYVDATLGCLREAGFSFAMADEIWHAVDSHVYGFTLQRLNFPFRPEEYASAARAFLPRVPAEQYPYFCALAQEVIAGRHDGINEFVFGLDLLLDGLERRLRSGGGSGPRARTRA